MTDSKAFRRILTVGSAGSGKSFAAKKLGALLGLPVIHLDNEFWRPGWEKTPREEWIEKQQRMISEKSWIIDGYYGGTLELRYAAADMILFLDINRFTCMVSAFRRHGKKRSDLPEYLEEKMSLEFLGFCKEIWKFRKDGRQRLAALQEKYPEKALVIVKNRKQLQALLSDWEAQAAQPV